MTTRWRRETSTKLADADMALEPANRLRRGEPATRRRTEHRTRGTAANAEEEQRKLAQPLTKRAHTRNARPCQLRPRCSGANTRPVASKKETTHGSKGTVDIGQQRMAQQPQRKQHQQNNCEYQREARQTSRRAIADEHAP
ncbi:hypothetical protein ERJ75_001143000 [Trypanosoma vivax]|nr:hypothetical protein ERJ75_001143000 [Trypanosoma vivax]